MTLKAKRLLSEAEVVLFDRLLSPEMLKGLDGAELIDVGKTAGNHKMTQEEINQLLIDKAEENGFLQLTDNHDVADEQKFRIRKIIKAKVESDVLEQFYQQLTAWKEEAVPTDALETNEQTQPINA